VIPSNYGFILIFWSVVKVAAELPAPERAGRRVRAGGGAGNKAAATWAPLSLNVAKDYRKKVERFFIELPQSIGANSTSSFMDRSVDFAATAFQITLGGHYRELGRVVYRPVMPFMTVFLIW
jgi:hypothetical protein